MGDDVLNAGKEFMFDFPFKKVKGKTLGHVMDNDPSYLDWLCETVRRARVQAFPAHACPVVQHA